MPVALFTPDLGRDRRQQLKASRGQGSALGGRIVPGRMLAELLVDAAGADERTTGGFPHTDLWTDALLTPVRAILEAQTEAPA